VLYLDVSKVDRVLHLPPRLLLPRLSVSYSPSVALYPSQTTEGACRGMAARTQAHSPLPLRGLLTLRFTFSVRRGCLDGMLPLVGLGPRAGPRFGLLRLGAACGRAASGRCPKR